MTLIDEEGRLFGRINLIDAIAVLLAFVAIVAAASVVLTPAPPRATRYATVEATDVSPPVARQLDAGDIGTATGQNVTITDVYVAPSDAPGYDVWLRVAISGRLVGPGEFRFAGAPLRTGTSVPFSTSQYELTGTVTNVSRDDDTLPTQRTPLRLQTNVTRSTAAVIDQGDAVTVAGRPVATIEDVRPYPTDHPEYRLVSVGLRVRTIDHGTVPHFGRQPVRVGSALRLPTDEYDITGAVRRRGNTTPPGRATATTARVLFEGVDPAVADEITAGEREVIRGHTLAEVIEVRSQNATVIVRDDDGHLHARPHPRNQDVYATVKFTTRQRDRSLWFHGRPLALGTPIRLDLGRVTVEGRIVQFASTTRARSARSGLVGQGR